MKTPSVLLPALLLCGLAFDPARAVEVYRGRCHMQVCAYFTIQEKSIVASHRDGALFRRFGISRVPCVVVLDADGRVERRIDFERDDLHDALRMGLMP